MLQHWYFLFEHNRRQTFSWDVNRSTIQPLTHHRHVSPTNAVKHPQHTSFDVTTPGRTAHKPAPDDSRDVILTSDDWPRNGPAGAAPCSEGFRPLLLRDHPTQRGGGVTVRGGGGKMAAGDWATRGDYSMVRRVASRRVYCCFLYHFAALYTFIYSMHYAGLMLIFSPFAVKYLQNKPKEHDIVFTIR